MEQELEPLGKVREEEEKIQLKQNLERLLEKELEKSPDEINVERIDAVISLLAEEKKRKEMHPNWKERSKAVTVSDDMILRKSKDTTKNY